MEIVPTSSSKKKRVGLDGLMLRKADLKQQIQERKLLIISSSQKLVSPASITSYIFGSVQRSLNLVDGFVIGLKVFRFVKRMFHRFR